MQSIRFRRDIQWQSANSGHQARPGQAESEDRRELHRVQPRQSLHVHAQRLDAQHSLDMGHEQVQVDQCAHTNNGH